MAAIRMSGSLCGQIQPALGRPESACGLTLRTHKERADKAPPTAVPASGPDQVY